MANGFFDIGKQGIANGTFDWSSQAFRMRLMPDSYTFDVSDSNMAAVGAGIGTDSTITTKSVVLDTSANFAFWKSADNPGWSTIATGSTVGGVVLYRFVTDDAGSTPLFYYDVTNTPTNGSSFTFTWASDTAGGVFKIS